MSWRSFHYGLAVIAGLFIFLASSTGLILAFEPWVQSRYAVSGEIPEGTSFADFSEKLDQHFLEVFGFEKDAYGNIKVEGIGLEEDGTFYLNAATGEPIEPPRQVSAIFNFSRDLHRSLFLKTPGRLIVGLASLAMVILAMSGLVLLIRRAGGFSGIFKSFPTLYYARDGHAYWGRALLLPILILSLTGTFLSVDRFSKLRNESKPNLMEDTAEINLSNFPLSEIKKVIFPVLEEEALIIESHEGIAYFDNQTQNLIRFEKVGIEESAFRLSFQLHTAEGMPVWGILLGLTAVGLLFLSGSGFKMILDKRSRKVGAIATYDLNDVVILVGSETGHTWRFATTLQKAFSEKGVPCSMLGMNQLPDVNGRKTLLFLTSTYGNGDAPENALGFTDGLQEKLQNAEQIRFGVLGFGSREYEEYCVFAEQLRNRLNQLNRTVEFIPYMTVDNRSPHDFMEWVKALSRSMNQQLEVNTAMLKPARRKNLSGFQVIGKSEMDDLVLLRLSNNQKSMILSGDLLAVYPPSEAVERYYSIAIDPETRDIILMIKRTGVCSNYLANLGIGERVEAFVKKNPSFYKPIGPMLMIANGTGLAPFLGMLEKTDYLFWGSRYQKHKKLVDQFLVHQNFRTAFSKERSSDYVQDLIAKDGRLVHDILMSNGSIMICGSISMLKGVSEVLEQILADYGLPELSELKKEGRILTDCY